MQIPKDIEFWMYYESEREEEAEFNMRFFSSLSRLFLLFPTISRRIVVNKVIRGRLNLLHVVELYVVDGLCPYSFRSVSPTQLEYSMVMCLFTSLFLLLLSRLRLSDRIMILSDPVWQFPTNNRRREKKTYYDFKTFLIRTRRISTFIIERINCGLRRF